MFRVDAANPRGGLDLMPLAAVKLRSGEVKPQGGQVPTDEYEEAIAA